MKYRKAGIASFFVALCAMLLLIIEMTTQFFGALLGSLLPCAGTIRFEAPCTQQYDLIFMFGILLLIFASGLMGLLFISIANRPRR